MSTDFGKEIARCGSVTSTESPGAKSCSSERRTFPMSWANSGSLPRHLEEMAQTDQAAALVEAALEDCCRHRVGAAIVFGSGFAETGEPEFAEMQRKMVEMALAADMAIVGPNCLGIYNRRMGVRFGDDQEVGEGGSEGGEAHGMTCEQSDVAEILCEHRLGYAGLSTQ